MARHIRNCKLPTMPATNWGATCLTYFMRHAFDVGGWTTADNSDSAWSDSSNLVLSEAAGANGFQVAAASPRQITHQNATGGFTQAMVDDGMVIALRGSTNDQNYSMWRITEYIDANNIKVDPFGFSEFGWVDESNMAGKVLDFGGGTNLTNGAWVTADPPSGNNQARFVSNNGNYVEVYARPRNGLADTTQTPGSALCLLYDNDDRNIIMNAYFDGNHALFYKFDPGDDYVYWVLWGELQDVPTEDTFPGFVMARGTTTGYLYNIRTTYIYMLGAVSYPAIEAFADGLTNGGSGGDNDTYDLESYAGRRLINGRPGFARLRDAWVTLANTASEGAFTRGRLPVIKVTHQDVPEYAPIDGPGNWFHLINGICVPRIGPLDTKIKRK